MKQAQRATLTRREVLAIFKRNHGAASRLADELGKSPVTVSQVLRGKGTSQVILDAARARAAELLDQEELSQGAA